MIKSDLATAVLQTKYKNKEKQESNGEHDYTTQIKTWLLSSFQAHKFRKTSDFGLRFAQNADCFKSNVKCIFYQIDTKPQKGMNEKYKVHIEKQQKYNNASLFQLSVLFHEKHSS